MLEHKDGYNNRTVLKTAGDYVEYMSQFPKDTNVRIFDWDCYDDAPFNRVASASVVEKGKKKKTKEILL